MSEKIKAAEKLAQIHYESASTTCVYRAFTSVEAEDQPDEPLKLLEVNKDTIPTGIVPLRFGPLPERGIQCTSVVIEVTPDEFRKIEEGQLQLPEGWENLQEIPRLPQSVSMDE